MENITMENCNWCRGSGREDGHLPCPDCQGTGYRYGKAAEQYLDELMDNMHEWHETLTDILVETFGYPEKRFIPKDVVTFVMNYFGGEQKAPSKEEVRTFMVEEIGVDFFAKTRPYGYGQKLSDGRLCLYTSLISPPEPILEEAEFLRSPQMEQVDFIIMADNALDFLTHAKALEMSDGVFGFSKEAWKDFPSSIQLHTDIPIVF